MYTYRKGGGITIGTDGIEAREIIYGEEDFED